MHYVILVLLLAGLAFPFFWLFGDLEFSPIGLTFAIWGYLFLSWAIRSVVLALRDINKPSEVAEAESETSSVVMVGLMCLTVTVMLIVYGRDEELFWHGVIISGLFASWALGLPIYYYLASRR